MNVTEVSDYLHQFAKRNRLTFDQFGQRQSQLLELAAITATAEHYRAAGYFVEALNPRSDSVFVVKTGTRGHPSKYSRYSVSREGSRFHILMNCLVRSARDEGIYCVDVAVVPAGVVPEREDRREKWRCVVNGDLQTFAEVKRLVVYPMLIAQFIGIVHEILPSFLSGSVSADFLSAGHCPPALLALGSLSGNSKSIIERFGPRGISIRVVPNLDVRIAYTRKQPIAVSPLTERSEWD